MGGLTLWETCGISRGPYNNCLAISHYGGLSRASYTSEVWTTGYPAVRAQRVKPNYVAKSNHRQNQIYGQNLTKTQLSQHYRIIAWCARKPEQMNTGEECNYCNLHLVCNTQPNNPLGCSWQLATSLFSVHNKYLELSWIQLTLLSK